MSKKKRKLKKKPFLVLFVIVLLGLGFLYFLNGNGTLSNEIGKKFDLVLEDITKSTEAYNMLSTGG